MADHHPEIPLRQETLILASGSPRRRHLLRKAGIPFEAVVSAVEEWHRMHASPIDLVRRNAALKARAVALRLPGSPVLAADTIVSIDSILLNKPADLEEARKMLQRLSGRSHTVVTAVCLIWMEREIDDAVCATSRVTFRVLNPETIDAYFCMVNPLDKAGAYGIQEGRELIIERFEGSLSNIMGLPMEETEALLDRYDLLCALRKDR